MQKEKITPEQIMAVLKANGVAITEEEAKGILEMLRQFAGVIVEDYLRSRAAAGMR